MDAEGLENNTVPAEKIVCAAFVAAVVLFCLYVRWRLLGVPLERDEGEYAYMGQLLLKEIPPYLQAYTMKLPGISAAYALIMLVFGQTVSGIHLGLLLVNLACIVLVGLLGRRLFDQRAALFAAGCYAMLSLSQGVYGVFTHATHFVVLFALAGFLLVLRHFDSGRLWPLLAGGFCLGLSITMKQHAVFFAGFALCYYARRARRGDVAGRSPAVTGSLFLFSMALPLLLVMLSMVMAGTFSQFWFWTVRYAMDYATRLTPGQGVAVFATMFPTVVDSQLFWWVLSVAGFVALFFRPHLCRDRFFLFGLLLFSFLSVCAGFYFRGHYFILLLPAVALLVAAAMAAVDAVLSEKGSPRWLRVAIPCLLMLISAGYGIYRERAYLLQLSTTQVSRLLYDVNPFPESLTVARYLREHTSPEDAIAVIGSEPQIYFYADRRSATGHIYMYGLMEGHSHAESMQREMISEIEASRPKYVVFVNIPSSWLVNKASPLLIFEWLDSYLAGSYDIVGTVEITLDRTVYNFDTTTAGADQLSGPSLLVYRRKS